jgi:hypothetical protein
MKVAEPGLQRPGFDRAGFARSAAIGFKMTRANADLKPSKCGRALAMRTSTAQVFSADDLSFPAASQSERLDNPCEVQVWSRTCYTHVK